MDILLTGHIAEDGVLKLVSEHMEEISRRYASSYINAGISALSAEFADEAALKIMREYEADIFVTGRQGILQALYKMGSDLDLGLRVHIDRIPIRQFCIEIADMCDVNPYRISSLGCVLACCADGARLAGELDGAGFKSTVIGYTTDDKARCAITGAGLQYITPED